MSGELKKCHADMYADPPRDCDAPFCGCNPEWNAALHAARQSGWLTSAEASKLQAELAELRNESYAHSQDDGKLEREIERLQGQLAELRKPVAVEPSPLVEGIRTIAQNHAREVSAREAIAAEMRGLRERLSAETIAANEHFAALQEARERERQLRGHFNDIIEACNDCIMDHGDIVSSCRDIAEAALAQQENSNGTV